jgi:protocatechuate 3,4-dioxygenase beta subunit
MNPSLPRRRLLAGAAAATLAATARAATRVPTAAQMEGPFYPRTLPLDDDNDLTRVRGVDRVAEGVITDLEGRVFDLDGRALAGVRVEIWQVDARGGYHHVGGMGGDDLDPGFQGWGRTTTDADGRWRFRTVRPVAYPGRVPHVHFALTPRGTTRRFATQMYLAGHPGNASDFVFASVADPAARAALEVALAPATAPGAQLAGRFDITLDRTAG